MKINQFLKKFKLERLLGISKSKRLRNTSIKGNRKRQNERGFALPLVIGIGLLMLLLGITTVIQSQSSQINSSIQKKTTQVGEVAEIGASRMQTFFNNNRRLALTSLYDIAGTTTNSWVQSDNFLPISCNPNASANTVSLTKFQNKGWINIDAGGSTQYRVVGYDYTPSVSPSSQLTFTSIAISTGDTKGTVKTLSSVSDSNYLNNLASVKGQIAGVFGTLTRNGSTYTFTLLSVPTTSVSGGTFYPMGETGIGRLQVEGRTINGSTTIASSGLQVEIPVFPGGVDNIAVPGIWVGSAWPDTNKGKGQINGNALVPCGISTTVANVTNGVANQTAYKLPTLAPIPSTAINLNNVTNTILLPRTGDLPTVDNTKTWGSSTKIYEYSVNNIALNGQDVIVIDPNYKVSIFLRGNFSGGSVQHEATPSSALPTLDRAIPCAGSTAIAGTCQYVYKPTDFKIYGYNTPDSTSPPSTPPPPEICVTGNRSIDAFLLAPTYKFGRTGTASITGSVWVKEFMTIGNCASAGTDLAVTQRASWDDFDGYQPQDLPPAIAPIKTWNKREAL